MRSSPRGFTASSSTPAATGSTRQRVRQTEQLEVDERPAGEDSDPSRAAMLAEARRDLAEALSRLSANQRLAVVLRDVGGLDVRGDCTGRAHARRHGEVLRAPRAHAPAGAARGDRRGVIPSPPLSKREIEEILPHRDPFLLLDEVTELEPGVARRRAQAGARGRVVPGRALSPAARSCRACSWSRRWPRPGAVAVLADEANRGQARPLRRASTTCASSGSSSRATSSS